MQVIQRICADCGKFLIKIAAISAMVMLVSGCQPAAESATASVPAATSTIPDATPAALCDKQGYLSAELFGALVGEIEWTAADFECEGMPRPDGAGARLRFAGDLPGKSHDEQKIAIIISLPELRRGDLGTEYKSKVTVIVEGVGRFFSTGDNDICWTDIVEFQEVVDSDSKFTVAGTLYCVAPLIELNGDSDVTFRDFEFRGQLDWDAS